MAKISRQILSKLLSPVILIALWYAVALFINAPLILPYPHNVINRLFGLACQFAFWKSFLFTFLRVLIAFKFSVILGFAIGLLSADFPSFKSFIQFPLTVIRVTPIIAFILITLFWFQSDIVPVVVAVLMSLPVMITSCEKGFEKSPENKEKLFKAECYGFTGFYAFLYIRLRAAKASIMSGSESAFGLCWKVVAAGEVFSLPHYAAGTLMQKAQVHLETADVLAVTTALIIVSGLCQFGMKKITEHSTIKKELKSA